MSKDVFVLKGVKQTLKALEAFDKDAVKEFNKVINKELNAAKQEAQSLVTAEPPLSGWRTQPPAKPRSRGGAGWPAWDQSVIKAGITASKAEGRARKDYTTSAGSLKNRSAAGVIYELAGRVNRTGSFIRNLDKETFKPSRLIWKVVDKRRDAIEKNVFDAFEKVKDKLQRNLNRSVN
jgi:hypothetical protein